MEGILVFAAFGTLLVLGIALTLIPAFIAFKREHYYKWIILVLSLFAWTGVVWVAALVWAVWPGDVTRQLTFK